MSRQAEIARMRLLADQALSRYGIRPSKLTLLSHEHSTVFRVTAIDGAQYVLRLNRVGRATTTHRVPSQLASEVWWLMQLEPEFRRQVPVVARTDDGEATLAVSEGPEERLAVLLRWMDGRFLKAGLHPHHLREVGRLTARLHNHSERLSVPEWFDRPRVDRVDEEFEEHAARVIAERWSGESAETARRVVQRVRRVQEKLGEGPDVFGLIHADIHQFNYLFHRGQVRLIDFDDSGWGHYLYDPAVTLSVLTGHPRVDALRAALLAGYRDVRPLSAVHETLIDAFYALRELQDATSFLAESDDPASHRFFSHIAPSLQRLGRFLQTSP